MVQRANPKRRRVAQLLLVAAVAAAAGSLAADVDSAPTRGTWTLRVSWGGGYTAVDPAAFGGITNPVSYAICAKLYDYPDRTGRAGSRLVPEVAQGAPRVSNGGRTFVFTLRRSFRFDTGARVTAANFAWALNRTLQPALRSPGAESLADVVGAAAVQAGRRRTATGISASGYRLTIRLLQPGYDLSSRLALSYFCAIPTSTPADPHGMTPASAGPYYVQHLDQRTLVLARNRFYGGSRPANPARIVWSLNQPFDAIPLQVERGDADYGIISPASTTVVAHQYPSQFHFALGANVFCLALNSDRPLFKNNPQLRKAVNYAIDRRALAAQFGYFARQTIDHYLPPDMPGFHSAKVYPRDAPDFARAKRLAAGHTRTGRAVMMVRTPVAAAFARARIVQYDLGQIGLSVSIVVQDASNDPSTRGQAYDLLDTGCWTPGYMDPAGILDLSFDGRLIRKVGNTNVTYFDSPVWNRRLEAAARLSGKARYRAYGKLDVALARGAAPAAAYAVGAQYAFVSKRVGCARLNPVFGLSLGAVCLRR